MDLLEDEVTVLAAHSLERVQKDWSPWIRSLRRCQDGGDRCVSFGITETTPAVNVSEFTKRKDVNVENSGQSSGMTQLCKKHREKRM